MKAILRVATGLFLALGLAACVVYAPPPVDPMDRPWSAAMAAMQDAGLTISTADRVTGTLRGSRSGAEVVMAVRPRGDGSVEVRIDSADRALAQRVSDGYDRRMGR